MESAASPLLRMGGCHTREDLSRDHGGTSGNVAGLACGNVVRDWASDPIWRLHLAGSVVCAFRRRICCGLSLRVDCICWDVRLVPGGGSPRTRRTSALGQLLVCVLANSGSAPILHRASAYCHRASGVDGSL